MAVNRTLGLVALLAVALPGCASHGYVYYEGSVSAVQVGGAVRVRRHHVRYLAPPIVVATPQVVAPVVAPQVAAPQIAPPATNAVNGSDGTFGWRARTANAEDEVRRLTDASTRAGCQIESSAPTETRAVCGGVSVLIRSDDCDVYKLCRSGTRLDVCGATWARIGP